MKLAEHEILLRKTAVAGRFYQQDPEILKKEIGSYLAKASEYQCECSGKTPIALMLPHAGYVFSGIVTGITLGHIRLPDTVIMLGPNHTGRGAPVSIWPSGAWATPLGNIPVDEATVKDLLASQAGFIENTEAHQNEHSLEILLPFLKVIKPDIKIVPICIGTHERTELKNVGMAIAQLIKNKAKNDCTVTIIGSTDMSHHIPSEIATRLDSLALEQIINLNPDALYDIVTEGRISMCGIAPVTAMLYACNPLGASKCCITMYTNSGITGAAHGASTESVVGYAGAIII